jgi:hypothetical protein
MTQYDLPPQALLQQSAARPISGEELETYGKHAAARYLCGECCNMNEAVVETVKHAGLAPEQVKRVCEFANTDAFLKEFRKEASSSKYVVFNGGPADFSEVLKDLNDGGGGSVFDRGMADFAHAPDVVKTSAAQATSRNRGAMEKVASVHLSEPVNEADQILEEAFRVDKTAAPIPFSRPLQDVEDLQDKLSTARDAATAEMSALEATLLGVTEDLYNQVKQAALDGTPLGHVVQAWDQALAPNPELVKAAFAEIGPKLVEEGVVPGWSELGQSLEKTAGQMAVVHEDHPVVTAFGAYCEGLEKLAELRATRQEFIDGLVRLDSFTRSVNEHYPEAAR